MKLKALFHDPMALLGLILVVLILIMTVLAPSLSPHDPLQVDTVRRLEGPSRSHPLGTDHLGRCILSRIIHGSRLSLGISFLVLLVILSIGTLVGILAAYLGGWIDDIVVAVIDVFLAFPGLILALVIAGILGPGIFNITIAMASVQWVGYARIVRGMVTSIKKKEYVQAARSGGSGHFSLVLLRLWFPSSAG